ncbi:MAG: prepilin-type N-terminal cleavage/methylation domain-containing protein [Candidatus Margulisiibacteriota bacterium]
MKKGFTLIELLIVMAAAGIISVSVFSDFGRAKKILELETSSQEIANALRLIRQKAWVTSSQTEFEGSLGNFVLQRSDPVSNSTVIMSSKELPKKILFDSPVSFKFAASGFPVAGYSGTAILRNASGATKKIIVSSFGRIRIE